MTSVRIASCDGYGSELCSSTAWFELASWVTLGELLNFSSVILNRISLKLLFHFPLLLVSQV